MGTQPRHYIEGATCATTRRTNLRSMFLGPWDPRVNGVILYSLAHAAQRYGVQVHHFVAMMNHIRR